MKRIYLIAVPLFLIAENIQKGGKVQVSMLVLLAAAGGRKILAGRKRGLKNWNIQMPGTKCSDAVMKVNAFVYGRGNLLRMFSI